MTRTASVVVGALILLTATHARASGDQPSSKSGYEEEPGFGGPTSVREQLVEDDLVKEPAVRFPTIDEFLKPWFDWKRRLNQDRGLQLGIDYNALYQGASSTVTDEDNAASGALRFFGRWDLLHTGTKDTGTLVFKVENRHRLGTDIPPSQLGFDIGYNGVTGTLFSDVGNVLVDLNWQQSVNDRRGGFLVGRYDPNDFMDVNGHANPWTTFSNLAVLVNTSIALPDTDFGIAGGHWIGTDHGDWRVSGGFNDANALITETELFQGGAEFFAFAEVGWSPKQSQRYTHQAHVMLWHVDERTDAGIPESQGVTFGANWVTTDEKWMPFFRAGWSDGGAPINNATVTAGFLRRFHRRDLLGLGANWGDPSDDNLRDQYSTEAFYRFQFSQNLAFTPSLQWLLYPALDPEQDQIWVAGLRMRATF